MLRAVRSLVSGAAPGVVGSGAAPGIVWWHAGGLMRVSPHALVSDHMEDALSVPFADAAKKLFTLLDLCVSSLRRGHANLLCIVPILTDDLRRGSRNTHGIRGP